MECLNVSLEEGSGEGQDLHLLKALTRVNRNIIVSKTMTAIQEGIVIVGLSPVIPLLHPSKGTRLGMGTRLAPA